MGFLCFASENGTSYVPRHAVVFSPAKSIDRLVKISLVAAGFLSVELVREFDDTVTTSVVTEPPLIRDDRERHCLSVSLDTGILLGLASSARVEIGSLIRMFPSSRWRVDGGAQVINWGASIDSIAPVAPPEISMSTRSRSAKLHTGKVGKQAVAKVYLGVVPSVFTQGLTRVSKRVQRVDDINLQNGDIVRDADGITWYFDGESLRDRISIEVASNVLRTLGNADAVGPRNLAIDPPVGYIPDSKVELHIVWPRVEREGETVVKALAFRSEGEMGAPWGFHVDLGEATVQHSRGICQGKYGVATKEQTPELCVRSGGTWDRPCQTDTECPFYDPRRNRGGCDAGGFCEMPLGVDRRSFRMQENDANLMRLSCDVSDPDYPWCSSSSKLDARFAPEQSHIGPP